MRYATAGAFRSALEQRLLTASRQTNRPIMRLRKQVVFDRLLARLLVVAPDRWLLKGALALALRFGATSRATKDMDLARGDSDDAATTDLLRAQSIDLGDHFTFVVRKTERLGATDDGGAVRYHVTADLAGRPFEEVIIDVGFDDPLDATPDLVPGPELLGFAGIAPVVVPVLPLGQHVAEKVHAYTRTYRGQGPSTRVKDLVDLVLIPSSAAFEAGGLRRALVATFATRATHPLPIALPPPPSGWGPAYGKQAREIGLDPDVVVGHRLAAAFLDPILSGATSGHERWDPEWGSWSGD